MSHLTINGIGDPNAFSSAIEGSELLQSLVFYQSSAGNEVQLIVDTSQTQTKDAIDTLLAGAGITAMSSQFVEGKFPAGSFHDASDDDE